MRERTVTIFKDGEENVEQAESVTLGELLQFRFDLCSVPKKAAVLRLAQFCSDPVEAAQLTHLCGKTPASKQLWSQFVEGQRLGMAELLLMTSSCAPSLTDFLSCLALQQPRYYSIASSPLAGANRLSFAFSVVHYTCGDPKSLIQRYGVCTSYLESILSPWLTPTTAPSAASSSSPSSPTWLRVFHKPSVTFRLPGSVSHPLILIGPGTGVAPFVGFLTHREQLEVERKRGAGQKICTGMWRGGFELEECDLPCEGTVVDSFICSISPGPILLYFGCRDEGDFLYKDKLNGFFKNGTLTELRVAMSRGVRVSSLLYFLFYRSLVSS